MVDTHQALAQHGRTLQPLLLAYRAMEPAKQLIEAMKLQFQSESLHWSSLEFQAAFMEQVVHDSVCDQYPPEERYTYRLLKAYLAELEAIGADVDDDLAGELMTLLLHSQMSDSLQSDVLHHVSYSVHDSEESSTETVVTCRVTGVFNEVGLKIWEAGWFLAEYILAYPELFRDRCVLELGAGVGFTGLVLAACTRPRHVLLSDYAPNVMQNLRYNVEINSKKYRCPVDVVTLDWDTWQPSEQGDMLLPDILLAGDCVYDVVVFPSLVRVLHVFMDMPSERQRVAIFASTIRNQTTFQAFLDQLEQFEIEYVDVTTEALQAMGQQIAQYANREQIRLCHLSRAKSRSAKIQ